MRIATLHPYGGKTAHDELTRVAALISVIELHPHTQKFDGGDPRVLALVQRNIYWSLRNIGYPQLTLAQAHALERLDLDAAEKAQIRYGNAHRLQKK